MTRPADIANRRTQRDAALAAASAAEDRVARLDAAIARARRTGQDLASLERQRDGANRELHNARTSAARLATDALNGLVEWLAQTPEQVVETCDDALPFVLLPVRIETKFAQTPAGVELRVRVFPDDISVPRPATALTDAEAELGRGYWRARVAVRHSPSDAALRRNYEGAWARLAASSGMWRAGRIVRATAPVDLTVAPSALVF